MNIGLVIYSWSGHTLEVAEKLKSKLESAGHAVTLLPVELTAERKQGARDFEIAGLADLSSYESIVFGAAVEAFSLSPVLSAYLSKIDSLSGKKVACLVSQQFPFAWMGGNRALNQMKKLCRAKGASIIGSAVVHWTASKREASIASALDSLTRSH